MAVRTCAACGLEGRVTDRHCTVCGASAAQATGRRLDMGPAAASDWSRLAGPGAHGPFVADSALVSWATCGETVVGLRDDGRTGEFVTLDVRDGVLVFSPSVPSGNGATGSGKLIAPLLGGPLGVFAVSAEQVAIWSPGARLSAWKAPGVIVAVNVSACGELWVAVQRDGDVLILAGTGAAGMTLVASLAGFIAPGDETPELAVDSEAPGRGVALLLGRRQSAVIEDGVVTALVPAPLETAQSGAAIPRFQPPWRVGRPWLTDLGGDRAAVVWDGTHLTWFALPLRARAARALVMTERGACVAPCDSETLTITWNAVGSRLMSRVADTPPLHGVGLGLEDEILFAWRGEAGAGFAVHGVGQAQDAPRLDLRLPATTDMLRPAVWLPPLVAGDTVWAAMLWRSRLVVWRCPLTSGQSTSRMGR